ncbi:hypothetical protein C6497_10520 [Candidatus Poribacteria bacterium]|nr:MAG: hypothetical protein C6497_10520 [Candidatus Poribacteria bacterium]
MIFLLKTFVSQIRENRRKLCLGLLVGFCLIGIFHTEVHAQERRQMEVIERDEETGRATKVNFNFTSEEIKNVLEWLSRETDLTIIATEDDIQGKKFSLINLYDVTIDQVIEEVKTVLSQYNLTLVRRNSTLVVTTFDKAIVMTGPVKQIEPDPEQVELTDEIQTYIIPLQNADASEQANALKPLLNNRASIFADTTTNALIVTDVSSNIQRIVSILQFADEGERFPVKIAVIPLNAAVATEVAQTLTRVFEDNEDDDQKFVRSDQIDPEQIKQALEQGLGVDLVDGMIKVYADADSNTLILKASEDNLVIIKEIILHLDKAPTLQTEIRTYQLKYASAEDVVTTLDEIVTGNNIQGRNRRRTLDRDEMFRLLRYRRDRGLSENLFQGIIGLVNLSRNDRLNIVVISTDPRNFSILEKIITELDQKKTEEEMKMYFLQHANAEALSANLTDLFEGGSAGQDRDRPWWERNDREPTEGGGFGVQGNVHIVHDIRLNALLVSTATANFPMIDDLIGKLDVSMPDQEWGTKIFYLNYADAENVAELLNSHYGGNQSSNRNPFDDWGWRRSWESNTSSPQTQGSLAGNVSAQPFINLNAIIVSTGTKRNFDMIEEFIKQIDVPTPDEQVEITDTIRLEYATAETIAEVLSQVWQGEDSQDNFFSFSRFFRENTTDEPTDINSLQGKVTVFADTDTNSLIVTTRRRYFEQVRALIKELDFVRGQVWIDIRILEVTLDETTKLGIEVAANERKLGGIELNSRNPLVGDTNSQLGLTQEISGFNYSLATKEYMALLHTLMRENKVKTLSTPSLLTRDSRAATWSSGRRIPYLQSVDTNSILGDTATQPLFNYDFIDPPVGINISLIPYIARSKAGKDGKRTIGLDITNISASNFIEFTDFNAPITDDNSLSVYIDVEDGQQLVVGGIIRKKQKQVENKVPILGDIPLLGRLFKSSENEVQDTEIVFIITPHIVDIQNPEDLKKLKQKAENWQENSKGEFERTDEIKSDN